MTLVRIIKDWESPNLLRQTPQQSGVWDDIHFTQDAVDTCDYVVVLNRTLEDIQVLCAKEHIWQLMQEPPVKRNDWYQQKASQFGKIYTQDATTSGEKYHHSQPALPWHVNRSYDALQSTLMPEKTKPLSWITSNESVMDGHKDRMRFLDWIQSRLEFDLWGRGFTYIEDKWDGLAPYHYALAIENYSGAYYWSEKLTDCFLSWTMPIYYGCTHIEDYFPPESMHQIDITTPDEATEAIRSIIQSRPTKLNLEAIHHARQLILDDYQLFPYLSQLIKDTHQPDKNHVIAWHTLQKTAPPAPSLYRRGINKLKHLMKARRG